MAGLSSPTILRQVKQMSQTQRAIAFEGLELIAEGPLADVARMTKTALDRGERGPVLIFDSETSELVEIDFRGPVGEVLERLQARGKKDTAERTASVEVEEAGEATARGPGRPKLGVIAREVTLLPRHWEWLAAQPGGASVTLRKLVEQARRTTQGADQVRRAQEVTYRFLHGLAGNLPGFEEATRALFAADGDRFSQLIEGWPAGVRDHARQLAERAFAQN